MTRVRDVLADCLGRQGVDASGRIAIAGEEQALEHVWAAFREFAALPLDRLQAGLHVPGPGRSDTDRLSLEARLRPRRAGANLPARPATVWLTRQLYLADAGEDFREIDEGSLRLVLADDFLADSTTVEATVFGGGGPVIETVTAAAVDWIARVEASAVWQQVVQSGKLQYAVLE